jgi:hypothetical protein
MGYIDYVGTNGKFMTVGSAWRLRRMVRAQRSRALGCEAERNVKGGADARDTLGDR